MPLRNVFFHVHVRKCGGSTFHNQILYRIFQSAFVRDSSLIDDRYGRDQVSEILSNCPWLQAYSSHKISLDLPYASDLARQIAIALSETLFNDSAIITTTLINTNGLGIRRHKAITSTTTRAWRSTKAGSKHRGILVSSVSFVEQRGRRVWNGSDNMPTPNRYCCFRLRDLMTLASSWKGSFHESWVTVDIHIKSISLVPGPV